MNEPASQDTPALTPEDTIVPDNIRVGSLEIRGSEAKTPPASISSFTDRPSRIEDSDELRDKAGYINRKVDEVTGNHPPEDLIKTPVARIEYDAIEDLNSPTANGLFEAEGRTSLEIERTMGRDRAMQLLGEIKNLTDETIRSNKSVTELEAASGAIGRLTFQDPRFPELKDTKLYSAVQGWTHAIIGINGLTAQAIDAKIKATHERLLKESQGSNLGKSAVN